MINEPTPKADIDSSSAQALGEIMRVWPYLAYMVDEELMNVPIRYAPAMNSGLKGIEDALNELRFTYKLEWATIRDILNNMVNELEETD